MHGIVPPFLLERLGDHPTAAVARCAQRTLTLDEAVRTTRRAAPPIAAPERGLVAGEAKPRRTIADAQRTMRLPGTTVRNEGDEPTGDVAVDEAYDGLGITWTLLHEAFGRDSLDGAGMPLLATVHYGEAYDNAFWNGERMVFGDGDGEVFLGFTGAVDVIGHELAHGLVQSTTDLVYQGQSGALNESVADVIGSLAKQHALGQTADEADWLVGAGLFAPGVEGVALRSLRAPGTAYDDDVLGKDPQPATMADYVETTSDNGGVHINSGIPNHAFYLAATAIGGRAWEGAGLVWLDVLTNGSIDVRADFSAFAAATVAAAETRFGADSTQRAAIADAWDAVGVTGEQAPTTTTDADGVETVRVERSGGLLGRERVGELPESALPSRDQRALESLIDSGELAGLAAGDDDRVRDGYVWRITVETRIDVTLVEPALPDDVLVLLHRILELGERR
ncbi:protealysin inhibitor emfourin [Agrococcus jejuensis]|uniref:Neutral metalloproteinase n=1 Tax=Agrococcus jejuensis TaxID=399736 RepID=A0A1G8H2M5_9MICO|nr:protealysin inhibitor emfourin [Agrococcus jejuensis]SDI00791.1 Thermolysin metallopeptidase, catalytic domain [Agrococcus jejuensis]